MTKLDILLNGIDILKYYNVKPEISQDTLYLDFISEKDMQSVSQKDIDQLKSLGWKLSVALSSFSLRLKDIK